MEHHSSHCLGEYSVDRDAGAVSGHEDKELQNINTFNPCENHVIHQKKHVTLAIE